MNTYPFRPERHLRSLLAVAMAVSVVMLAGASGAVGSTVGRSAAKRSALERDLAARPSKKGPTRQPPAKKASTVEEAADPFTSAAMRSYLASRRGNITAAVYDIDNDKTYLYRPEVTGQTASIIKVDILATLLQQAQSDGHPLGEEKQEQATEMIEESDNDDASDLWDDEGGAKAVAHFNNLVGMTDTVPNTEGYWGETTTTALDQITLLRHVIFANSVLDNASRAYELNLMEHVTSWEDWGVSNGPPPNATVALKNGWVPIVANDWQINSIGYVNGDGRSYLVAVLTNSNLTEDYGIGTIEGISGLIWSELAPKTSH